MVGFNKPILLFIDNQENFSFLQNIFCLINIFQVFLETIASEY